MLNKIVIAGGTGFIGEYLTARFRSLGIEVVIISRKMGVLWTDQEAIVNALDGTAILINLAGKSVNCRYHSANRLEILRSRIDTTQILGQAILACKNPPQLWLNSSTATIYRHATDRPMTEQNGEIGTGFSVDIAKKWEAAFFGFILPNTRQIALRMAIVLGKNGGVMNPLSNLVRLGLGGRQGSGKQMFSWIHIEDLFEAILFLAANEKLTGTFNLSSPHPVDNGTLMEVLRNQLGVKVGLPAPAWLLEIGAVLIRTETELILKSRWVLPERLLQTIFQFKFPTIDSALKNIVNARKHL